MTEKLEQDQPLWWQRGVVYQIYPRSYKDTGGDGVGDLPGITEKVGYLADTLGIDAVWLSPFYPSPMADFGYDVSNYVDVHPLFGDLASFDRLVAELHRHDIKIIIDYVPNHTSDQHPWFGESRSSRDNPRRDWYVWADPKPDGSMPNNWLAHFGGPAWEWDETTGQYYLHSFLKEQPDLNWRNPEVERAMLDVLRFWLDRGVDGFRIDVAHAIMKDPEMRDNPPNTQGFNRGIKPTGEYDSQLHLYDTAHPDVHEAFRHIRRLLDEYSATSPRMAVAEIHEFDWPVWASYYGSRLDEMHLPFNFALLATRWTARAVRAVVDSLEASLPTGAWPNYVLGNHDEHRVVSRIGPAQARVAMMLLLTLRGTPTVYYGDEIGMADVEVPEDQVQDPWGKNVPGLGLGRDPERTPMQWTRGPNAGFCPPDVKPWLPISPDYKEVNVEVELQENGSMLSLTTALLQLRRRHHALEMGSYAPVEGAPEDVFVYQRQAGDRRFAVALNFSDRDQHLSLADLGAGALAVSTHTDREDSVDFSNLDLRPNEGVVVALG